ncbi:MAG: V-type ATPase subunit [Candidatus Micrarchaeota archaeon]
MLEWILAGGVTAAGVGAAGMIVDKSWGKASNYARPLGVVYGLWPKLFTKEKYAELAGARSQQDLIRLCVEEGYHTLAPLSQKRCAPEACEEAIQEYLADHFKDVYEAVGARKGDVVTVLARCKHDYSNLKIFLKTRFSDAEAAAPKPVFSRLGTIDFKALWELSLEECWNALPKHLGNAGRAAEAKFTETGEPLLVDAVLDKELFKQLFSAARKNKFFSDLVALEADLLNLRALLRARIHGDAGVLEEAFIENAAKNSTLDSALGAVSGPASGQAFFSLESLKEFFASDLNDFQKLLADSPFSPLFPALLEFRKTGSFAVFDKKSREFLLEQMVYGLKFQGVGPETVYCYLTLKENEAANVLKIIKAKTLGLEKEVPGLLTEVVA